MNDHCRLIMQYYIITALERDQYEVLWSRVQQYWTRQYCCTLLHKTSYWSSSSVVIVLLHKILENFEIFGKFWPFFIVYCMGVTRWEGDSNFIHWFCTRVQGLTLTFWPTCPLGQVPYWFYLPEIVNY
jgi:hypothetical protein